MTSQQKMITMKLETENLLLLSPDQDMTMDVLKLHNTNKQHFSLGSPKNVLEQTSPLFWKNKLSAEKLLFTKDMQYNFYGRLKDNNQLICHIQVSNMVRGVFQAAHLGYKIDKQFQGKSLMFEALECIIAYLFDDLNFHRLMANYQPSNQRSGFLLERLGFHEEGFAKDYLYLDGAWRDHILTSKTNKNFDTSEFQTKP